MNEKKKANPSYIIKWVYRVRPDGTIEVRPVEHGKPAAQTIGPQGIASEEKFGVIGGK